MDPAGRVPLVAPAGLDLRLASGAAAAWLALVSCLGRTPGTGMVVVLVAAGLGLTCLARLAVTRRDRPVAAALALVAFCVTLVMIPFVGRSVHSRASPLARLAGGHAAATVELTVTSDPRLLTAKGVAGAARVVVLAEARSVTAGGRPVSADGAVVVFAPAALWQDVLPGQRLRLDGTLSPSLDKGSLSVTLFARSAPTLLGHPPWWQRAAGTVRSSLRAATAGLPRQVSGLLPGLVDGDTTALDPVLAERFRTAGLTHLVAVSGTNCSILVGVVLLALRRLRCPPWIHAAAGGTVLLAFVIVARPSPSVLRAAVMASIALVAMASGRERQAIPALSAAVLGLLVWDPRLAADAGFAMSVLATAALLVIAPGWAESLRRRHVPVGLAEALAVATAAHLVTAPVVAAISGQVSLVAIPANVLAEPVVAAATILGFAAAVISPFWLGGAEVAAWLAGWPVRWLIWDAEHLGRVQGATVPWPGGSVGGLSLLAVSLLGWWLVRRAGPGRAVAAGVVTALLVQIPLRAVASGWPAPGWILVACDVGQGDALVLPAGPHSAVAIDTGPDPLAVDRCLRDLGITEVPLVVLTHFHLDHVGGLAGVFHDRRVGRVVAGPLAEPEIGARTVRALLDSHQLSASSPAIGQSFDVGRVHLDVLAPATAAHGTRSDPNNSSLVLRATVDGVRIMLPGDAEIEAQEALVASDADLRADVLKVPHHGSAYSAPAFLSAVGARVAVISVGAHNDYGHPSAFLLAELARLGVPQRRTDRDGDIAICAGGSGLVVVAHGVPATFGG